LDFVLYFRYLNSKRRVKMQNKIDWKVGDRVVYDHRGYRDTGIVKEVDDGGRVWAGWEKDGYDFFDPEDTKYSKPTPESQFTLEEEQAVRLLLSLGYTLKKGV
jgi:hypothetical protein